LGKKGSGGENGKGPTVVPLRWWIGARAKTQCGLQRGVKAYKKSDKALKNKKNKNHIRIGMREYRGGGGGATGGKDRY